MDNDQNGVVSMVCQDNARRQDLDGNVDNRRECQFGKIVPREGPLCDPSAYAKRIAGIRNQNFCQWRYESGVARFANGLIRRDQINNGRRLHDIVLRYVFGNPEDSEIWSKRKLRDMTENHRQTVKEGKWLNRPDIAFRQAVLKHPKLKDTVKNIAGIEDEMGQNKKQLEVAVKDQGSNLRFRLIVLAVVVDDFDTLLSGL
ncbi:hypothetical protein EV421DRAFT_1740969 [Armillaria borealis]|uniref:Uncharacterized protein n=1 Tax=Armillaria borealis TaxID=47425 RepID=A0AA39J2Y3_9AGAR|nr:hypothetical protein EV421DRAFT_1740969 [Armillaria borealis]